ncbi:DNRLRE domain-containing protein [Streptomyces luteireticuli]|uniref:Sugar-binding protein n=1 Tax=Streptomyces luteireticuli TaxID=173858 RepID=A0ABN0Z3Y1_9ACTN
MGISLVEGAAAAAPSRTRVAPNQEPKAWVTEAADVLSARVAARLSGRRVEALSERTEASTTWVNKDGSLTSELSAGPVRFRRNGQWSDVDVSLIEQPDGSVTPKAHPKGLVLAGKGSGPAKSLADERRAAPRDLVTLGSGGQQITLQWKGGLPGPKLTGTRATYEDALPGADVIVEATRTGFGQFVEIKQRPAKGYSYTLPLKANGLKAEQQRDGSVLFTDKKNKKQAVMPAPVMWDSTVDKVSGEHTRKAPAAMKVEQRGSTIDLVVTPDAKFLANAKTRYPVTVDPSTASLGNLFDTYVQQGETRDWSTDTELDLGNPGTKNADGTPRIARSFITWNTAPISDALVSSATLSLWNRHSANTDCKPYPWEVWAADNADVASRWTNQPDMKERFAVSTETKGNPACGSPGWINADVTNLVQYWAGTKRSYSGMGLRAGNEGVTQQWKRLNSADAAANPPKLTVRYNYRPHTGTRQEAGPPYFSFGGAYVVNTTTPTLRDAFVDADGDSVNGTFQIFDAATDKQVGNLLVSKYVPSGQVASVRVPPGVLENGKTYKFRTTPFDGTHYNDDWSNWKSFTVDTKAPSAPAKITSDDYPSDKWVKGTGQTGDFTVTPPHDDCNWLEWSLDGVTWTKTETGGKDSDQKISIAPPKDGTHTLKVRAVDKADNKSEAITYTFHAGPGGFVQPAAGERTARRLPLVAEAETGTYDRVSFSWRRSEADAWTSIPAGDVTHGGERLTTWPVPMDKGRNAVLAWDASSTVNPDGSLQIKADFTGTGGTSGSTAPLTVVVDRNASGAVTEQVGPGSVNLLTGDYGLSSTDASAFGLSVTRTASSRLPDRGAKQEGQAPVFGKEWVVGTTAETTESDYTHLRKVSDTAVDVVNHEGDAIHFTATADKSGWIPEPGQEELTLRGDTGSQFTLADTEGTVTTFTKPDAAAPTWQVASTLHDGLANSTTTVLSESVTIDGKKLARPKRLIAPTSAATAAACTAEPATRGCRVMELAYATTTTAKDDAFGDVSGQVKEIRLWSTEPGAASATSKPVATYAYDGSGRLRQSWNPQITPPLKTEYAYDGAGRVITLTPPGELPWTLTYGKAGSSAAAGDGMLLKASRPALKQGTADDVDGEAATTVVYGVPLSGDAAPYPMGMTDVQSWGETDVPTDATAVFPADALPSAHSGDRLTSSDYRRADVHYLDVSGRQVNHATPGGHITTTEHDRFGNTVRELTAANREVALGTRDGDKAAQADLGVAQLTSAERGNLLDTRRVYNDKGTRELEEYGPLHRVDLTTDLKSSGTVLTKAGTSVTARSWTMKEYDADRPTDGTAKVKDQVTKLTVGAQVREHVEVQGDARVTQTVFDWAKGLPVKTIQDPGGLALTTTIEYDSQGRVTKQIPPGATGDDAATRVTSYWSATGTGPCSGHPEWADDICSTGPAATIIGGGNNPNELAKTTTEYDWWGNKTKVNETANGATRTTTTSHDSAGRPITVKITADAGQAVPDATTEYDPSSGKMIRTVSPTGGSIAKRYDRLGRPTSYTDADGGRTTTEYDLLNRPATVSDSVPSTVTYTYNHEAEPRGLATRTTDSVAGTFQATYDADSSVETEKLPGGYTLTRTENPAGQTVNRTYTRDADGTAIYTDAVTESIHGQSTTHAGWSGQTYRYDAAGRLTTVEDTSNTICIRRTYMFDARANRKAFTAAPGDPGAECPTSGGTTTTRSYDSADRLVDSGYAYDAFGRTTAVPGNGSLAYYANDLAYQQAADGKRQAWQLDASHRFRSWTVEAVSDSSWTRTASKINHYDGDDDRPRWIIEDTASGALTRNVELAGGDLAAITGKAGDVVLQLANIHGDVALQLPLDTAKAPVALDNDEYGNPRSGQPATRYNWLGVKERSTETLTGLTLMGVRLYSPTVGRFLQTDPVYGGNANAYTYPADPINQFDLDGRWSWRDKWRKAKGFIKRHRVGIAAAGAGVGCGILSAGAAAAVCAVVAGGAAGATAKWYGNRRASRHDIYAAGVNSASGYGGFGGAFGAVFRKLGLRALSRWSVWRHPARGSHRAPTSHRKRPWWSW